MATFVKGNAVANATEYELIEKIIPVSGEIESPNLYNVDIVNQYYKGGCFLAASAKWYVSAGFTSTNLIPLNRPVELYFYGLKQGVEMHLTWYDSTATEGAPTTDQVGVGNIAPVGGFTIKNGTNVGNGNVTFTYTTDSKGTACHKLTMASSYQTAAAYIRLGISNQSLASNLAAIYICEGERYQMVTGDGEITYESRATASEINFDVSALGLAAGDHTFVVKAKADGYTDSDYSNEVVYTAK